MKLFHVTYWAWPDGARIKTKGEFDLPANSEEDAIGAALIRWPEMQITSCEERK